MQSSTSSLSDEDESAPLNPSPDFETHLTRDDPHPHSTRDPAYVRIFYLLSCIISAGGLGCAIWGYRIVLAAPFDEGSKQRVRDGYERSIGGMMVVVILLSLNTLYTSLNFYLAIKGRQTSLWLLNMIYDFFLWALLIAFGVLNMVVMLWDRRLCDGWSDEKMYALCDIAMFKLLVVELVAVNLGLLVAVLHFILLIARCCTFPKMLNQHRAVTLKSLKARVEEEEGMLMELLHRRRTLIEETEELEAKRLLAANRPLPPLPDGARAEEEENRLVGLMQRMRAVLQQSEQLEAKRLAAERPLPPLPVEREEDQEGILTELAQERRALLEETAELEARRRAIERPLPPVPEEGNGSTFGAPTNRRVEEEDLIDVNHNVS